MQRCMELTVTNRSQAYPEKAERAEKFAKQTERANRIRECSTIEAKGIEDRVIKNVRIYFVCGFEGILYLKKISVKAGIFFTVNTVSLI